VISLSSKKVTFGTIVVGTSITMMAAAEIFGFSRATVYSISGIMKEFLKQDKIPNKCKKISSI